MSIYLWIFLILHISQALANDGEIVRLDSKTMQSLVMDSTDSWLIVFFDESQNIETFLENASKKIFDYGISVGTVDCTKEMKLCQSSEIRRMPSIRLITQKAEVNPYARKAFRKSVEYLEDTLEMRSLERFIAKNYPVSLVNKISSIEDLDSYIEKNSKLSTVILFSEKPAASVMFRTIAHFYDRRLNFVYVGIKASNEVSERYNISATTLGVLDSKSTGPMIHYDGGQLNSRAAVIAWLSTFASATATAADEPDSKVESPSQAGVNFVSENFLVDTVSSDSAWIVAVVEEGAELPAAWSNVTNGCMGHIKSVIVYCTKIDQNEDSSENSINLTIGQQMCKQTVVQLPFLFVMKHGDAERKKLMKPIVKWDSSTFQFTAYEKALKAVGDSLPASSVVGLYEDLISQFVQDGVEKNLLSFVLLSNAPEPPNMLKNIALSHSDVAHFGFISGPSDDLVRGAGQLKLPAIVAIPPPDEQFKEGMRVINYDHKMFGPVKFASLSLFIDAVHRSLIHDGKMKQNIKTPEVESLEPTQSEVITVSSEEDWTNHCGESFRGICAIGLLSPSSDESETLKGMEVIQNAMISMEKGAGTFRFLMVDATCQEGFGQSFGINSHELPTLVVYSPSKRRFQILKGSFSETAIKEFGMSILSGKSSTVPMSERPVIESSCANTGSESNYDDSADSEDAGDFLREIQREEEEKAAKLKIEIKEEQLRLAEEAKKDLKKKSNKKKKRKVKAKKVEL